MDVIHDVRRRYEVDRETQSDLLDVTEQALELLADQLYSTDTHFVMEFIQNAEDNVYSPNVLPTLHILVEGSRMILSCNELGFKEKNVRAICKIGGSTKKNNAGFIGEKGIGFKSVFKVADIVHVASGPYTFKFDRRSRLGMIAPIWDTSIPATPGWTTFHLDLSRSRDERTAPGITISEKLNEIKPSLLLFLKKLCSIKLDIKVSNKKHSRLVQIERKKLDSDFVQLIRIDNGAVRSKDTYIVLKHAVVTSDVRDPKRKDVNKTEVVLAFPVDESRRPKILPQDVHAFLPVRNFGFNFVIHGDFLTSSSREDILHDSPWNLKIRVAIVDAFIAAVQAFRKQPTLRDTWIRYLPGGIVSTFFSVIERDLFKGLQEMEVVRDNNGILRRPNQILSIPSHLRYKEGPLIPGEYMKHYYLSDDYDASADGPSLRRLGVRDMTLDDFLVGLAAMSSASLKSCDEEWHETVCSQLSHVLKRNQSRFDNRILKLGILPLDNGSWTQARNANNFVFDSEISGVPDHIDFRRIHWRISPSSTPQQYALFRALGVPQADPAFIADKILDFKGYLPLPSHIANAMFFFRHRLSQFELPSPTGRLQLVDEQGNPDTGENLYLDLPSDEGKLRSALPSSSRFIHDAYVRQLPDRERDDWFRWLHDCLHLNTAPRLVNGKLSLEFKEMTQKLSLRELLGVLKYFWPRWPSPTSAPWHDELAHLSVTLDDGSQYILSSTFLKRSILARYSGIAFLPVKDPESKEWNFLRRLGVTIEVDAAFFVKLLTHYQSQAMDDENAVVNMYKQLDARFDEDATRIRDAFNAHPLVFVASKTTKTMLWTRLSDVYWDGPSSMTSKLTLRSLYPNLREFFHEKLGMSNAPPTILIDELKSLSKEWIGQTIRGDVHQKVTDMLIDLTRLVEKKQLNDVDVRTLIEEHAIFPARHSPTGLRLFKLTEIYIPDRTGRYAKVFRDDVPMLEFSDTGNRLSSINHLLLCAVSKGLAHYLETSVDHQMEPLGQQELEDELTATYASRYEFIERLVHYNSKPSDRQLRVLSKLKEVIIYTVDNISSTLSLADVPPICTETELMHLDEGESAITVFVSRKAYSVPGATARVHIDICKCLGDMLDCDVQKLLLSVTLDRSALDILFQMQGIDDVGVHLADDDSWMYSSAVCAPSLVASPRVAITSQRTNNHWGRSYGTHTSGARPQNSCSMEELQDELDRIMDSLSDFSKSPLRVFSLQRFTPPTFQSLSRIILANDLESMTANTRAGRDEASIEDIVPTEAFRRTVLPDAMFDFPSNTPATMITTPVRGSDPPFSHGVASPQSSPYKKINGILGERYVYELLTTIIGPTFGPENWTSELRGFNPKFDDFKGDSLADFTFEDKEGILSTKLCKEDREKLKKRGGRYPTYHIEVKSTSSGSHEPFYLSKRQLDTALKCTHRNEENDHPKDVYVIIRVWNIRNPTPDSYAIYVDPVRCILDNSLKIVSDKVELILGS